MNVTRIASFHREIHCYRRYLCNTFVLINVVKLNIHVMHVAATVVKRSKILN
jgi:hypothetical protein